MEAWTKRSSRNATTGLLTLRFVCSMATDHDNGNGDAERGVTGLVGKWT
ncbi:hypothetical protein RMSM_03843 [Rhodopirellula maiorica SM1]|uniref:Uncharacterized protein n=1 Tax=Rhodopirellula maiorica SM1 TaxID=1265738 RepID=M5RUX2_9BACT|nr:hypothetical protein RMSM_03843 [Rhodopirellula maiorica SM1]